jgi:hypothetical protein
VFKQGLVALTLLVCSGCSVVPYKIPLSADNRAKVQGSEVYARADDKGVGVQYLAQNSSAAGAPYGLIGALVTATIDSIANARPAGIAEDAADKLAPGYDPEDLHAELALALSTELRDAALPGASASVTKMAPDQKLVVTELRADNVLAVELSYALTQDLRALQVIGTATVFSKGAVAPKGGKPGMVYRNRFEYCSAPLPAPPLKSQGEIDAQVAAIEAKYAGSAKDPAQDAKRKSEIAEARNPNSLRANSEYMVQQWLAGNGGRLHEAIRSGTSAVVNLLAADLADPTNVDVKAKLPAESVVRDTGGRVVARANIGAYIGSLTSRPTGYIIPLANATAYRPAPKAPVQQSASR